MQREGKTFETAKNFREYQNETFGTHSVSTGQVPQMFSCSAHFEADLEKSMEVCSDRH